MMHNFLEKKWVEWKQLRRLRRYLAPDSDFLMRAKQEFLAKIGPAPVMVPARRFTISRAACRYAAVACFALFIVGTGLTAYADSADVGVDNPLYPMKRTAETIQLAVAGGEKKIVLGNKFAKRRAREIIQIASEGQYADKIPDLKKDYDEKVNLALSGIPPADGNPEKGNAFCKKVAGSLSELAKKNMAEQATLHVFEKKCGPLPPED